MSICHACSAGFGTPSSQRGEPASCALAIPESNALASWSTQADPAPLPKASRAMASAAALMALCTARTANWAGNSDGNVTALTLAVRAASRAAFTVKKERASMLIMPTDLSRRIAALYSLLVKTSWSGSPGTTILLARARMVELAATRYLSPLTEYFASTQAKAKARKTSSTRAVASPRLRLG